MTARANQILKAFMNNLIVLAKRVYTDEQIS